jgi:hypothetical protein
MKALLTINYVKYYQLYHLAIICTAVILLNLYIGVSNVTFCEGIPELQHALYPKEFEDLDKSLQKQAMQNYETYIANKTRNDSNAAMERVFPTASVNKSNSTIESTSYTAPRPTEDKFKSYIQDPNLFITDPRVTKATVERTLDALINLERNMNYPSFDDKTSSEPLTNELNKILPSINPSNNDYMDLETRNPGKYIYAIDELHVLPIKTNNSLLKHLLAQYHSNCYIYTMLKHNMPVNADAVQLMYKNALKSFPVNTN